MFRYKILEEDVNRVKKYLVKGTGKLQLPTWGRKFKEDLSIKKGKLMFKDKEIVSKTGIDSYLRNKIYSKDAETATSRRARP